MLDKKGIFFTGLALGSLVGAGVALLMAPQPGKETYSQLKDKGLALKNQATEHVVEASHQAQDQVVGWQEKGKEFFAHGMENAAEAIDHAKENIRGPLIPDLERPIRKRTDSAQS